MADLSTANLIATISPGQYDNNVATNATITVLFNSDMDRSTFNDATIALQVVGTVLRVPCTYSYSYRILTITPSTALSAGTAYSVILVGDSNPSADAFSNTISGIKDILGNGMAGNFSWQFVTSTALAPSAPQLISPTMEEAIGSQPVFSWTSIAPSGSAAITYQVQVSLTPSFETIYWPLNTDTVNQSLTTVQPGRSFTVQQEYFWRVRAISGTTPGPWSQRGNFYYGDPTIGVVTPDDIPMGLIPPTPGQVLVTNAAPAPGVSNLIDYPSQITVTIQGYVDLSQINANTFWISGSAVDGSWDPNAFKPIFSPSLNGSIWGSGGITMPGPEDSYMQILVSGKLTDTTPQGSFDGTNTNISLDVPTSFFQDNNKYTIHLNLNELPQPLTWTFTSRWSPVFASSEDVMQTTRHFMPELLEDEVWYRIRRNSLYAVMIQVYVPTQVDGSSWIYRPPISFNINNPPFFAREYVRIKTGIDILQDKFHSLIDDGRVSLGDFAVDREGASLRQNISYAIERMEIELQPFKDKLHGHTNRGYARGQAAQRGEYNMQNNPYRVSPFRTRRGPIF